MLKYVVLYKKKIKKFLLIINIIIKFLHLFRQKKDLKKSYYVKLSPVHCMIYQLVCD